MKSFYTLYRWHKKAKEKGYKARSVFKLKEIDQKYHLFQKACRILDIGAHPGSWTQYCLQKTSAFVVAVDQKPLSFSHKRLQFIQKDILEREWEKKIVPPFFDLLLSDVAPSTTGIKEVDSLRSLELVLRVWEIASHTLRPQGHCVVKIFMGSEWEKALQKARTLFEEVLTYRPEATRKQSKEVYIIGKRKKN